LTSVLPLLGSLTLRSFHLGFFNHIFFLLIKFSSKFGFFDLDSQLDCLLVDVALTCFSINDVAVVIGLDILLSDSNVLRLS